jgi:hypothetical protein
VLCSSQDHLRIRMCDLDHPILTDTENTDKFESCFVHVGKGFCKVGDVGGSLLARYDDVIDIL